MGLPPAIAVDLAALRCPEADQGAVAEFKRSTPAPKAKDLTREDVKALIDRLRASEVRKNAAGQRVVTDLTRCRTPEPATS